MCYQNPDELLRKLLEANPLLPNNLGHTPLDDFEHFCVYSGLNEAEVGHLNFAWVKCAFITARLLP
jgi:hypothetical protein